MDPHARQPEGQSVLDCCGLNDYEAEESDMGSFASDDDVGDLESLEQERDESHQLTTPTPAPRCEEASAEELGESRDFPGRVRNGGQTLMRKFASLDDHVRKDKDNNQKRKGIFSPPDKTMRKTGSGGGRMDVDISRFAKDTAAELQEPKVSLLRRAMDLLGMTLFRALLFDVQEVEESGGQRTAQGDRRRTPGGVFWNLLKQKVSKEEYAQIFAEEKEKEKERSKKRQKERNLKRELEVNGHPQLAARVGPKPTSSAPALSSSSGRSDTAAPSPSPSGRPWVSVLKAAGAA